MHCVRGGGMGAGGLRLVRGGSIAVMSGLRRYRCGAGRCSAFSVTFPKRSRGKAGGGKWRAVSVRGGRGFRGGGCGFSVLSAGAAREFRRVSFISPGEPGLLGGGCRGWGKALLICAGGSYASLGRYRAGGCRGGWRTIRCGSRLPKMRGTSPGDDASERISGGRGGTGAVRNVKAGKRRAKEVASAEGAPVRGRG